jgi:hypothetical protein
VPQGTRTTTAEIMATTRRAPADTEPAADSLGFPNLAGVIRSDDVSTKGGGKFAASYVNWAKTAQLLHQHAPGLQFHLRSTPDGHHVWAAPDGTGYLVGYFTSPEGIETAEFPQAVMNNQNGAMPLERISARDVTDTHRRALCAAAAFTFGLAYELWAKDPVEDPYQREAAPAPARTPDPAKVLQSVEAAITRSDLTPFGIRTVCHLFSGGTTQALRQVPQEQLEKIPTWITRPDNIAAFNAGTNPRTGEVVLVPEPSDLEDPEDQSLLSLSGAAA